MNTRNILLAIVLGLLLVQFAVALDAKAAGKEAVKTASAAANDVKDTLKGAAKDVKAAADAKKEPVKEAVKDAKDSAKAAANDAKETVKAAAKDTKETVKEAVKDAKETVKTAAKDAKETGKENIKAAQENVKNTAKDAKETVKEAVKEAAKEVPKPKPTKETAPKFPKETPKDASFFDTYIPVVLVYVEQAKALAQEYSKVAAEYGAIAWKEAKKYGGTAAVLAQEYSVTLSEAVADYKKAIGDYTYTHAVELVDQFFDPQHAAIIKKNYLNYYGVAIFIGGLISLYLVVKHLKWMLSPKALQLFLTAVSFGIYLTLAALTILTSKDPTKPIPASTLATIHTGLFYLSVATTALNVIAFLVYPGRQKSFIVALLSVGLFVEELELHSHIENAFGTIPEYSLHALVFLLQAALVFDSIPSASAVVKVKSASAPVKSQEIKVEKGEKSSKKGKRN